MDRERIYVRQTMSRAVGVLVELLDRGGYRIDSIEEEHADSFILGQLQGRTDLIVRRTKDGMKAIIDLKWSGDKRKIEALKNGTALQLAAYSYFVRTRKMLGQARLILFFPPHSSIRPTKRTFLVVSSYQDRLRRRCGETQSYRCRRCAHPSTQEKLPCRASPRLTKKAQEGTDGMNIEPPCKWCGFQMFCRYA